jgi:hypothetical protein
LRRGCSGRDCADDRTRGGWSARGGIDRSARPPGASALVLWRHRGYGGRRRERRGGLGMGGVADRVFRRVHPALALPRGGQGAAHGARRGKGRGARRRAGAGEWWRLRRLRGGCRGDWAPGSGGDRGGRARRGRRRHVGHGDRHACGAPAPFRAHAAAGANRHLRRNLAARRPWQERSSSGCSPRRRESARRSAFAPRGSSSPVLPARWPTRSLARRYRIGAGARRALLARSEPSMTAARRQPGWEEEDG